MTADNLPRPEPLRSWYALYGDALWGQPPVVSDEAGFELVVEDETLRRAIAALPERIRRMDAVRQWAESMPNFYPEALLAANEEHGARIYASGMCKAAAMVLALLDGEA